MFYPNFVRISTIILTLPLQSWWEWSRVAIKKFSLMLFFHSSFFISFGNCCHLNVLVSIFISWPVTHSMQFLYQFGHDEGYSEPLKNGTLMASATSMYKTSWTKYIPVRFQPCWSIMTTCTLLPSNSNYTFGAPKPMPEYESNPFHGSQNNVGSFTMTSTFPLLHYQISSVVPSSSLFPPIADFL